MKTLLHSKTKFLMLMSVMLLGLASCKKNEPEPPVIGDAKMRVINTVSGSTGQDVYQNDTKLSTSAITYGQHTEYLTVKGGVSSSVFLKNQGTQVQSASTIASFYADQSYTLFYYSNATGAGAIAGVVDDNTPVASGKVRVRFMNLGTILSNYINVNITGGNAVISGLAPGHLSAYNIFDANTSLTVNVIGATETKVIPATEFVSGKIYTVWFDAANPNLANYHIVLQN